MRGTEVSEFIDSAYTWQERATKAEAEVERLAKINQECEQEAHIYDDILRRYKAENALLRKVAEAARIAVDNAGRVRVGQNPVYDLRQAIAELDKEGER